MPDLDGLSRHYQDLLSRLDRASAVERLGENLSGHLQDLTPSDTGTLAEAVSEVGPARRQSFGWSIGVGDLGRLGDPAKQTLGTLRAFFNDYRQFSPSIWKNMPMEAKELLHAGREKGLYGGPMYKPGDPARYYYAQEGGRWAGSSAAAHISPQRFTESSLDSWRADLPEMIGAILGGH